MESKKLKEYLKNINGVSHITFNPNGPGAVRIHLIPPKRVKLGISWIVILNGQDILPLTTGWAILLREFINNAIKYDGISVGEKEIKSIIDETIKSMHELFPKTKEEIFKEDLTSIVETLILVAKGEKPSIDIGFLTIDKYAKYMRAPHRIDLMISSMKINNEWHCNQKCIHCYAGEQKLSTTEELKTEDWKKIIDKCREASIPQITFTGGEPTLRIDLTELINYASWFVTRLNTNGVLLTKELCHALKEASLDSVQITLYSNKPEIHNLLVGANNFNKTVEGIKNAIDVGLNVSVNTPLCSINKGYKETIIFLNSLGVKYYSCSGIIETGNATLVNSQETHLTKNAIMKELEDAVTYCYAHKLEISFTSPGVLDDETFKRLKLTIPSCGACLSNMAVAPNGDVVPCQSYLNGTVLGNLLNDDFNKIWKNKITKNIRKKACLNTNKCQLSLRGEQHD